jgi:protein-glucosylgalactosylhydroxylysine glucosidase
MLNRRDFIAGISAGVASATSLTGASTIDRKALVQRHNPVLRALNPRSPLSIGNGEFAFTADLTGLQTFPSQYEKGMPLCTQSQWGWHSFPAPAGKSAADFRLTPYETHGRKVGYPTSPEGQRELYDWLRENPHRLHLGRIGLWLDGAAPDIADLAEGEQVLDLWTGQLASRFRLRGIPVQVETACHPSRDLLAVRVISPLIGSRRLTLVLEFPYGSGDVTAADWRHLERHSSRLSRAAERAWKIERTLDGDRYHLGIRSAHQGDWTADDAHRFIFKPKTGSVLELAFGFFPRESNEALPSARQVMGESASHWRGFWSTGGALDLSGSSDTRAHELERRTVLSQYLTAIQCSGSLPPQETGLTCNSWYGKFHLEMHWWHSAHFPLWGRTPLLERSLSWYREILPEAQKKARGQGYAGARWPKMVGPEGRDSPSGVGPLLIWQQPHPIAYAELCYQSHPDRATLGRYREIVFETADFMASFAFLDEKSGRYNLGPPVIPAQENHPPAETWNPVFELEYWHYGLLIAQRWRQRLGLAPEPAWERVRSLLAPLPVRDGMYPAHANCPQTFTERNRDHPSMLAALGVLAGAKADHAVMRATLKKVMEVWRWEDTWGWDYPMAAMTAARVGEPELAIKALLLDTPKNRWLENGHVYQRPNLPLYLPANGGLLAAVAMMAAGWRGGPETDAPGFPKAGWKVRHEGLRRML